jgi:AraC-like DNA-binding protein
MMPELDGIALTRRLRADDARDRLPILLLTARAGEEDAVVGLEAGADDYVTKPFSIDELRARLERLLETRGGQTAPDASPALLTPNVDLTPANEEFLGRVTDTIEAHLSRSSLTVDDLADEVGISARQLQRKLKDLTGHTAAEFVCRYRLDCAAELLEAGADSISQVAYRVGFGTPDTFVQHFRKHFDCAPSEYAERHGTTDAAPSS